jgi:hypothetical protein
MSPSSESASKVRKQRARSRQQAVSSLAYFVTLKMEIVGSSETSVNFCRTNGVISQKTVFFIVIVART